MRQPRRSQLVGLLTYAGTDLPRALFAGKGSQTSRVRRLVRIVTAVIALLAGLMIAYLIFAGWLYPLRPDTISALPTPLAPALGPGTWGGPTLLGAWAVHALVALIIQAASVGLIWLCRAASRLNFR